MAEALRGFVKQHNLGLVTAPDGMMRLAAGLVRVPCVAFISWDRLPERRVPAVPLPALAVEMLGTGNTAGEMARKRLECFSAGVRLEWLVYPEARTVAACTGPGSSTLLRYGDTLSGHAVLPGFSLSLRERGDDSGAEHP